MAHTIERILLLGMTPLAAALIEEIDRRPDPRRRVVGVLDDRPPPPGHPMAPWFLGPLRGLAAVVNDVRPNRIVVALAERRGQIPVHALLDYHISHGIDVEGAAECYERLTGKLAIEALTPMSMMDFGRDHRSQVHRTCAALVGRAIALVALLVLSPLLAVIALAVRIGSRGPVLFVQQRVGEHGRPFQLMKFRTMHVGLAATSEWEVDNRDRVTGVGAWLRAFRLDELPQLVNVLRGEMNLVGPRPHPSSNFELFTLVGRNLIELTGAAVSCYALRGLVRPGLSGWAQVRYRYANNLEEEIEKLRYDLYYIKHQSLWLDLCIMIETIRPLVLGRPVPAPGPGSGRSLPAARRATVGTALAIACLLAVPGALVAQSPGSTAPAAKAPAPRAVLAADAEYRIGTDDVIEIAVWDNAALTRTVLVRPDGRISLPLLHDVTAAGLTPMELQAALTAALAGLVKAPEVSVIVREVHSRKVSVIGEVRVPGVYRITGRTTVLDVLATAGGLTQYADHKNIVLIRQVAEVSIRIPIDYDRLMAGHAWAGGRANVLVLPGDILTVR